MSYGYYRLPHGSKPQDYLARVVQQHDLVVAVGESFVEASISSQQFYTELGKTTDKLQEARAQGYSGDTCSTCQGSRMKWAGHCQVCEDCGSTTGCS